MKGEEDARKCNSLKSTFFFFFFYGESHGSEENLHDNFASIFFGKLCPLNALIKS